LTEILEQKAIKIW